MKRILTGILLMTLVLMSVGCGARKESTETGDQAAVPSGTWQTATIGYEADGEMQPEYYVQFEEKAINYGHMKDGEFTLEYKDDISALEESAPGIFVIRAQSSNGGQYTYRTSESDKDILEYYETWNEDEFGQMYRAGASLSRSTAD